MCTKFELKCSMLTYVKYIAITKWFMLVCRHFVWCVKVYRHLYANANEACETVPNPNERQKVIRLVKQTLSLQMYFSLKYRLQTDSDQLFTEHSPHKRMLFAVPWLHVDINISLTSICLIRHSLTDLDAAWHRAERMIRETVVHHQNLVGRV